MLSNVSNFFNESGLKLEEFNLLREVGLDYWHTCILDASGKVISGGFGEGKSISRKIALSEYFERVKVKQLLAMGKSTYVEWGLDQIPTGCGFAVGFDENNVRLRSVGEAIERWVLSKWIDENFRITEISYEEVYAGLDPVSRWLSEQFDQVRFFEKDVIVLFDDEFHKFKIGITVGKKDGGAFLGSSAKISSANIWQHSLLESFRHVLIKMNSAPQKSFPDNRIRYFACNYNSAALQISCATKNTWSMPQISFHKLKFFDAENFFLARTIIRGWTSWHLGPTDRFLY